jgi:diaminopimelate epimerase
MDFYKVHGLANDFLIIDAAAETDYNRLAIEACARHTGIGADGLLVLDRSKAAGVDYSLRFFNSDGSEAEMSGNGIRCAAAALYHSERASGPWIRIATKAGIKGLTLSARDGVRFSFEVMMGKPCIKPAEIPIDIPEAGDRVLQYPLAVDDGTVKITATAVGNPHCTVFVEDFDRIDWRTLGAKLESHPAFPNRTNVEFVRVVSANEIEALFWERGVGETQSSGTGACGAAIASMLNGFTERQVRVKTPAGLLSVEWCDDEIIVLNGPAEIICQGQYFNF